MAIEQGTGAELSSRFGSAARGKRPADKRLVLSRLAALVPPLAVPDRAQSNISSIDKSVTVLVDKPRSLAHAR